MKIYPSHGYARRSPQDVSGSTKSRPLGNANMVSHVQLHTYGSGRKKCIKDSVEIHHIKQREGESTKDFVRRFKVESRDVKGAPEIMKISGFIHGITNPEMIKRLHDKIPKSVDKMMRITTSFLRGMWQLVTKNERSHFRHGNSKRSDISRISKNEVLKISKGQRGDRIDRNQKIQKEVKKLIDAGIMKEVHYHSWLSNLVMVKKHDDTWRMCVDFKDLNKACPKDGYPLPKIDWKVESLFRFPFK
nr:reverse transcriptase domain-containing protein [Tanacetum cinerariifolium]